MNIIQLYQDFSIPYQTEGHKHCRPGWINTPCPFCSGNAGLHLGATLDGNLFYCWRCGYKHRSEVLSRLLNVKENQISDIIRQYGGISQRLVKETPARINKTLKLPSGIEPLKANHKKYLEKRGFDPDKLEREWDLQSTGVISLLDGISYKHRIFIPIEWKGQAVTFQCRDVTGRSEYRYLACPEVREIIKHKHILYGQQESWTDTGICVEGVTDVWRFGKKAFATFGIKFTPKQVREISKYFDRVVVVFDDEPQAQAQADILVNELRFRNVDARKVVIEGDPGGMPQKEADYFVKQILT